MVHGIYTLGIASGVVGRVGGTYNIYPTCTPGGGESVEGQ